MASPKALSLLAGLLHYDPGQRTTATAALQDPYFFSDPPAATPDELAGLMADTLRGGGAAAAGAI